ncbi:MAG: hypothetical protein AAF184_03920 [Pseudomonadota bacterium]
MKAIAEWLLAKGWRVPLTFVLMAVVPDQTGQLAILAAISGTAILAVATLRSGFGRGLELGITGVLAVAVLSHVMERVEPGVAHPDLLVRVSMWAPALVCAAVIRRTRSLTLGVQVLLLIGLGVMGLVFLLADPYAYWLTLELEPKYARVWTGISVAAVALFVAIALLLAHHGERSGRTQEHWGFDTLAMGKGVAMVSAVLMLISVLVPEQLYIANAVIVLGVGFALQGLAVASAWMEGRGFSGMWAVALYAGMLLSSVVTLPLMVGIGFIDNWLQLRQRWRVQR